MELVSHGISVKSQDDVITIIPIGDIQWAGHAGGTSLDTLKRTIEIGLKNNAWFIGMGDYIDFMSPSNRQRFENAALYDTSMSVIENAALDLTHEIYELALKDTKNHWLGMLAGHHFFKLRSGDTTDMRLCQMLNAPFLGDSAYIRLKIDLASRQKHEKKGGGCPIVIWATHGTGSGTKAAAPLNKLENISPYFDADIFLMGHQSKIGAAPLNRVSPRWHTDPPDLIHRKIYIVATGSFMKGYEEFSKQGQVPSGSYVEKKMMNPVALGAPIIRIRPQGIAHNWNPQISVEV